MFFGTLGLDVEVGLLLEVKDKEAICAVLELNDKRLELLTWIFKDEEIVLGGTDEVVLGGMLELDDELGLPLEVELIFGVLELDGERLELLT